MAEDADTPSFWSVARRLRREGQLCDIQLCVSSAEDQSVCEAIQAHKVVLVASSHFFQTALQNGELLDVYNFVGLSIEDLQVVIDFMYREISLKDLLKNAEAAFAAQIIQVIDHKTDVDVCDDRRKGSSEESVTITNDVDSSDEIKAAQSTTGAPLDRTECDFEEPNHSHETEIINKLQPGASLVRLKSECRYEQRGLDKDTQNASSVESTKQDNVMVGDDKSVADSNCLGEDTPSNMESLQSVLPPSNSESSSDQHSATKIAEGESVPELSSFEGQATQHSDQDDSAAQSQNDTVENTSKHDGNSLVAPKLRQYPKNLSKANLARNRRTNKVGRSCSPKVRHESSANETMEVGRFSQRKRKMLNYKLLAEGADMADEDAEVPDLPTTHSPAGVTDTKALLSVDPDFSVRTTQAKRKRGRPPKVTVTQQPPNPPLSQNHASSIETNSSSTDNGPGDGEELAEETFCKTEAGDEENSQENNNSHTENLANSSAEASEEGEEVSMAKRSRKTLSSPRFQCLNCSRRFISQSALAQHRKLVHGVKVLYGCTSCGMELDSMRLLEKHKKDVHQMALYACDTCGLQFKTRDGLKLHQQKKHSGEEPTYICPVCSKAFFLKGELKNHIQFHSEERKHQCDKCSRAFKSRALLVRHENTYHSNERKFQCDVCGTMFKTRNDCKAHRMKHFRQKNPLTEGARRGRRVPDRQQYPCQFCGKMFKKRAHQLVHENLQHKQKNDGTNYLCTICSKVFPIRHYLMQHIKNCHSERRFACTRCSQMFAQRGDLKKHESIPGRCKGMVAEPKPFSCPHCQKGFSLKGNLAKHLQHPERCRYHPSNQEVIVVLQQTVDGTAAVSEEGTTDDTLMVLPAGEDAESESIRGADDKVPEDVVGVSEDALYEFNHQDGNMVLQGIVDGKVVPISMSTVNGQCQFHIGTEEQVVTYEMTEGDDSQQQEVIQKVINEKGIKGEVIKVLQESLLTENSAAEQQVMQIQTVVEGHVEVSEAQVISDNQEVNEEVVVHSQVLLDSQGLTRQVVTDAMIEANPEVIQVTDASNVASQQATGVMSEVSAEVIQVTDGMTDIHQEVISGTGAITDMNQEDIQVAHPVTDIHQEITQDTGAMAEVSQEAIRVSETLTEVNQEVIPVTDTLTGTIHEVIQVTDSSLTEVSEAAVPVTEVYHEVMEVHGEMTETSQEVISVPDVQDVIYLEDLDTIEIEQ